jgi:phage shock protein C
MLEGGMETELRRPLRRSRSNRMIAGVVAGLAEYLGIDVTLARVIYVIAAVLSAAFPGALVYLVLWLVIPEGE